VDHLAGAKAHDMPSEHAVAVQWSRLLERYLARPTVLFVR